MRIGRMILFFVLLSIALLVLSGCGPRVGAADAAASPDDVLVVSLPALVLDVNEAGEISLGGTPLAALGAMAGQDLSDVALPADVVNMLVAANVQHIQLNNTDNGLDILLNGEAIPSLGWDADSLEMLVSLLGGLDFDLGGADSLLPLLTNVGVGATLQLPLAPGATPIPLEVTGAESAGADAQAAQSQFLSTVGTPPQLQIVVTYAADGTWTVAGLTEAEWSELTGAPWDQLNLPPEVMAGAQAAGIESFTFSTNPDGIFFTINDQPLPYLDWSGGSINHLLEIVLASGLLGDVGGDDVEGLMAFINQLLPALQTADVMVKVNFP